MDAKAKLKSIKKKTIELSELSCLFETHIDSELYVQISMLVSEGLLAPVKRSGKNGNLAYPLFLKYRIMQEDNRSDLLDEIVVLHPLILKSGYLQAKPEEYAKHRDALKRLNAYLFSTPSGVPVSRKERSFAIFGEEKLLEDSAFHSLLSHLGLNSEVLCYYDTPEYCFNEYIPCRSRQMTLLICENKDIWFNIRRRMFEDGCREIFGTPIDGVVYGCGNRISESGALGAYTRFLGAEAVKYLYWGDIDRAGFDIYLSVLKNNPELPVDLFADAYFEMVRLADGRSIPDSKDGRGRMGDYREVLNVFSEKTRESISELLDWNKRLPQEIINYEGLLTYMR